MHVGVVVDHVVDEVAADEAAAARDDDVLGFKNLRHIYPLFTSFATLKRYFPYAVFFSASPSSCN